MLVAILLWGISMKDSFSTYHPSVNFIYFVFVMLFNMFFMHPACLIISLVLSFSYSIYLKGKKAFRFNFLYLLPTLAVTALINPAFNHEGVTVVTYLQNGNPLTLESILYGLAAATMFVSIICWFSCYNEIMTTDKFVYLFGRIIPSMSLIISMVLRFVPKFKSQIKLVSDAQKCIGRDVSNGTVFKRIKYAATILSIMVTWSLENAIETADSMKSRGYGLPGRTAFSIFIFDSRDKKAMGSILFLGTYILIGALRGCLDWRFFPSIKGVMFTMIHLSVILAYFILCAMPLFINFGEDKKWKLTQSKA